MIYTYIVKIKISEKKIFPVLPGSTFLCLYANINHILHNNNNDNNNKKKKKKKKKNKKYEIIHGKVN